MQDQEDQPDDNLWPIKVNILWAIHKTSPLPENLFNYAFIYSLTDISVVSSLH